MEKTDWETLTPEEKKRKLYLRQKAMLEGFLARGAITRAQFEKSFGDLTVKMGMEAEADASAQRGKNE